MRTYPMPMPFGWFQVAWADEILPGTATPLFYFEFQAPNRFQTTILDGTPADLLWEKVDGKVWVQS